MWVGELPGARTPVPAGIVINVSGTYPHYAPPVRIVLALPFLDVPDATMLPARADVERFLDGVDVHAKADGTYWHCHAGINRASFVAAAYMHRHRGMRISQAIDTLRERRSPLVLCNPVFERVLREWFGDAEEQEFEPFTMERYLEEVRRHMALLDARGHG